MKIKFILIFAMIFFAADVFCWTQDETRKLIKNTQKKLIEIDNNLRLRPFIPYDIYGDSLSELIEARTHYKNKNYTRAYYLASISSIKLETISLLAEAKKIRDDTVIMERDYYRKRLNDSDENLCGFLLDANLQKKDDSYIKIIYDRDLFSNDKNSLTTHTKNVLSKIFTILKKSPLAKLTIAGHTSEPDYKNFSKYKAELVSKYFLSKGIDKNRIKIYGMGNNEVINTPWGFKNLDRIELIIYNFDDYKKTELPAEKKSSGIGNIKVQ